VATVTLSSSDIHIVIIGLLLLGLIDNCACATRRDN
jgi:hypothetical protein